MNSILFSNFFKENENFNIFSEYYQYLYGKNFYIFNKEGTNLIINYNIIIDLFIIN